jgi:hypothetical protein
VNAPEPCLCGDPGCARCPVQPDPITDVDDFEVIAEDDRVIVSCPVKGCETQHEFDQGWWAPIGDIIRTAREHEHRFAAPVLSDTTEETDTAEEKTRD